MVNRKFTLAKSNIGDILVLDVASTKSNDKDGTSHVAQSLFKIIEASGFQKVLIDMKGISTMTSDVIGQLVMLIKKCRAGEFQLKLCGVVSECKFALNLVRLDQLVEMHEQKTQGVVAFRVGRQRAVELNPPTGSAADFIELAKAGDAEAQFQLGKCFETGSGVETDFGQALNWFEKAAKQEHLASRYALGIAHAYGIGTPQNFDTAFDWFRQAADQGHAEAQFWLGLSMQHGLVGDANPKTAIRWYKEAAEQGHHEARDAITEIRRYCPELDTSR